jgi:hypothetical protein
MDQPPSCAAIYAALRQLVSPVCQVVLGWLQQNFRLNGDAPDVTHIEPQHGFQQFRK